MADDGILRSHDSVNLGQGEGSRAGGEWDTQSRLHLDSSSMHEDMGEREGESEKGRRKLESRVREMQGSVRQKKQRGEGG